MEQEKLLELIGQMSIEDKIFELLQLSPAFYGDSGIETGPSISMGIGETGAYNTNSVLNYFGVERILKLKQDHIKNNKHHIPIMTMADILHGYETIFPVPLALGCSFDPELIKKCYSDIAAECCVAGIDATFAPMVDLVRDPRWGRVVESTGEDPYLNAVLCKAMVEGFQGDGVENEGTICACVKHFAAYGAPEGGRDYNTVDISDRSLRQDYLPSYEAGVRAGSELIMTSFNSVGGVPSTANKTLLRDILRKEWGFDGVVITDWGSANTLINHGVAKDQREAAKLAIEAGVDIEMCTPCYILHLKDLIENGEVDAKLLDDAVYRVLSLKNKLGLFEKPERYASAEKQAEVLRCDEFLEDAYKMACESSVLLKNDGALPLSDASGKIAFIGPYTECIQFDGAWVPRRVPDNVSFKEVALKKSKQDNLFAVGSRRLGVEQEFETQFYQYNVDDTNREKMMKQAEETAAKADTIVMMLGEHFDQSGEARGKSDIRLPDIQLELLRRVYAVNKNIVSVVFGGRPLDLREVETCSHAILFAWFPGTCGADAVYDMLYGITEPSGRLSITFPYSVGQIPTYYNHMNTDHPYWPNELFASRYIDIQTDPMFCFGEGMGYTEFEYSGLKVDPKLQMDGSITASVTVKNVGKRVGSETLQMYIRDMVASVVRPLKELKGFERISLEPGESKTVSFKITSDMLKIWDINMKHVAEPGMFRLFIGHDSRVSDFVEFELLA